MSRGFEFRSFIKEHDPGEGGCVLFQDKNGRYYLLVAHMAANGPMYTINNILFHEYSDLFKETSPWTVLYKNVKQA